LARLAENRSEQRSAYDCGVYNLVVIFQTLYRRSIQLVELKGRRRRHWFEKKRESGSRVPQASGFEV
jgi:hypothetical protein